MRRTALIALLLILTFVLVSLPEIGLVTAESIIYIREDGSVDGTNLIERHDNTYTFLNNISGSIVISKDFITIDGSGFALIGTDDSSQKGISLSNRKNVTVSNMVITNYFIGTSCGGTASNITILNNNISSCGIGIEFLGSSNNLVKYNTFKNNDIDIAVNYVSENVILITQNSLNDYVQVWMSEQQTIDMNYWADYNGTDANGDGIGDSAYFYKDTLQDNHPLMEPVPMLTEFPSSSPSPTPSPTSPPTTNIVVNVSSPIQNETYFTNDIPLSFSYDTNITTSPDVANYTAVFTYNLDGQPNFDMFGNPVFGGKTTRIGAFYQPIPLDYNSSIHVPNGNHSLFVMATFWITPTGEYQNKFDVRNVSQVVNFTVSAETPTSSNSPTPTPEPKPEPFPTTLVITSATIAVVSIGLFVYFKKRRGEAESK